MIGKIGPKDLPIYTHMVLKGKALKIEACHLFSFSEKEKEKMLYFCKCLNLSNNTYSVANTIYLSFLRNQINVGVLSPIPNILACIYIAAIITGEDCPYRKLSAISKRTSNTIRIHKNKILKSIPTFSQIVEKKYVNMNKMQQRNNLVFTSDKKEIMKKFQLMEKIQ